MKIRHAQNLVVRTDVSLDQRRRHFGGFRFQTLLKGTWTRRAISSDSSLIFGNSLTECPHKLKLAE
jgi:hypothetical protein